MLKIAAANAQEKAGLQVIRPCWNVVCREASHMNTRSSTLHVYKRSRCDYRRNRQSGEHITGRLFWQIQTRPGPNASAKLNMP